MNYGTYSVSLRRNERFLDADEKATLLAQRDELIARERIAEIQRRMDGKRTTVADIVIRWILVATVILVWLTR